MPKSKKFQNSAVKSRRTAAATTGNARSRKAKKPNGSTAPSQKVHGISKLAALISMMQAPNGATIEALVTATGWQSHSVRGAIAGTIKKKLKLAVSSEKIDGVRTYRIAH